MTGLYFCGPGCRDLYIVTADDSEIPDRFLPSLSGAEEAREPSRPECSEVKGDVAADRLEVSVGGEKNGSRGAGGER